MRRYWSPALVLRRMVCGRCGDLKLPGEVCEPCAAIALMRRQNKLARTADNWRIRTAESKRASYISKRKKSLFAMLNRIELELNFLNAQKEKTPENIKVLDKQIAKLLNKREKTSEKYRALLKASAPSKQSKEKQSTDKNEIAIKHLQRFSTCVQIMADAEMRCQSSV
jgi:hypothetical protein